MRTITLYTLIPFLLFPISFICNLVAQPTFNTASIWTDDGVSDYPSFYPPEEACDQILGYFAMEGKLYKHFSKEGRFGGLMSMNSFEVRSDSVFYKDMLGEIDDQGPCTCENGELTVGWSAKLGREITYIIHFMDSTYFELRYFDYRKDMNYLLSGDTSLLVGEINNPTKIIGRKLEHDPFFKLEKGEYSNGKKTGHWQIFYANGQVKEEGAYLEGEKHGSWKEYFEGGRISAEGNYQQGLEEGLWSSFRENGQLSSIGSYTEGKKNGEWKYYFSTGILMAIKNYKGGNLHGLYETYDQEGNIRVKGPFNKGAQNGIWYTYYSNGQIETKGEINMEQKTGVWQYFYENGQLQKEGYLTGGRMEYIHQGTWKYFYENGQLQKTGNYSNDQKTGKWTFYKENGLPDGEGNFQDDQMSGFWKIYDELGRLKREGTYQDGILVGEWVLYHPNGQVSQKSLWEENRLLEIVVCKDGKGKDLYPGTLKNGTGTVIAYDMNGEPLSEFEYQDGVLK